MPDIEKDTLKEWVKEGIKEWLNDRMTDFAWWSLKGIGAAVFAGLIYLALIAQGWKR